MLFGEKYWRGGHSSFEGGICSCNHGFVARLLLSVSDTLPRGGGGLKGGWVGQKPFSVVLGGMDPPLPSREGSHTLSVRVLREVRHHRDVHTNGGALARRTKRNYLGV